MAQSQRLLNGTLGDWAVCAAVMLLAATTNTRLFGQGAAGRGTAGQGAAGCRRRPG